MIYGFICAIPAIILAGPVYARFISPRINVRPDDLLLEQYTTDSEPKVAGKPVSITVALVNILLPVLIMLGRTLSETILSKNSGVYKMFQFVGDPVMAMFIGLIIAIAFLDTHAQQIRIFSAIALGWVISALLSVSTGSATVGIVGASGLLAPLIAADQSINTSLLVVAIGSGSIFFNYANYAGFWLVKESFGMTMGDTFKTNTMIQTIVGIVGLVMALLLNLF